MDPNGLPALASAAKVFADTSWFYAVLVPDDVMHARAVEIAREIERRRIEVFTTWEIVVESATLLRDRASFKLAELFLTSVLPAIRVVLASEAERQESIRLFLKRSGSAQISLCDALSYSVVTGRLEWLPCLSFDRDFGRLGLPVVR